MRSRASLIVLITLAFLLMAAALVLVFSLPEQARIELPTQTTQALVAADSGFACQENEALRLYPFGSDIIQVDSNRIVCRDIRGVERFSVRIDLVSPLVCQNSSYFLVADRDGYDFVVVDSKGEVCRGAASGRISATSISATGQTALIHETGSGTGVVTLYAPQSASKLFDCYNPESGYPLSVAFPPQGEYFDIALVNTSGSAIRPVVKRYGLDGKQIGQRLPDSAELLPLISYDQADHLVLCGATYLVALTYDSEKTIWQQRFNQILAVRHDATGLLALARDKQDGPCSLLSFDAQGKKRFQLAAGDWPNSLDVRGELAATASGTRLLVMNVKKGKLVLDTDIAAEIIRIGFTESGSLTVICRDRVRRVIIPES